MPIKQKQKQKVKVKQSVKTNVKVIVGNLPGKRRAVRRQPVKTQIQPIYLSGSSGGGSDNLFLQTLLSNLLRPKQQQILEQPKPALLQNNQIRADNLPNKMELPDKQEEIKKEPLQQQEFKNQYIAEEVKPQLVEPEFPLISVKPIPIKFMPPINEEVKYAGEEEEKTPTIIKKEKPRIAPSIPPIITHYINMFPTRDNLDIIPIKSSTMGVLLLDDIRKQLSDYGLKFGRSLNVKDKRNEIWDFLQKYKK